MFVRRRDVLWSDASLAAVTFLLVIASGLALQFLLIPMILHGSGGLAPGSDWAYFHRLAVEQAKAIADQGWSAWRLRPEGQAPAGIASIFYTYLPNHPSMLLPLHGALFATAVVMARRVLILLVGDYLSATLAVMPFLLLPSFAMIWGQLHKDIFSGAGMLLVLSSLLSAVGKTRLSTVFFMAGFGGALMVIVRPYLIGPVVLAAMPFIVTAAFHGQAQFGRVAQVLLLLFFVLIGARLAEDHIALGEAQLQTSDQNPIALTAADRAAVAAVCDPVDADGQIDRTLLKICTIRAEYFLKYPEAGSNLSSDVAFRTKSDYFAYLPEGLLIGFFRPIPFADVTGSSELGRATSALVSLEMALAYFAFALALALGYRRLIDSRVIATVAFLIIYVLIHVYAVPNLGTLYRMRLFAFIMLVSICLAVVLDRFRHRTEKPMPNVRRP